MTRQEEIRSAGQRICWPSESTIAFKKGAEWADANPKSPWISVEDDLPNNPKYLKQPDYSPWVIAITENGEILSAQMIVMNGKWVWHSHVSRKHEDITHWMPIPKLKEE